MLPTTLYYFKFKLLTNRKIYRVHTQYPLPNGQYSTYNIHWIYYLWDTIFNTQHALYNLQCTMYNLQHAVQKIRCKIRLTITNMQHKSNNVQWKICNIQVTFQGEGLVSHYRSVSEIYSLSGIKSTSCYIVCIYFTMFVGKTNSLGHNMILLLELCLLW